MDKAKAWIAKNYHYLKYLFLLCSAVACFNCLAKPDYNLVLYAYAYFVWNMMEKGSETSEKMYCFWFMLITIFVDLIWIFYWQSLWGSYAVQDDEASIHFLVILFSWISLGLKGFCILMVGVGEWATIRTSLPKKLQEKLNLNRAEQQS